MSHFNTENLVILPKQQSLVLNEMNVNSSLCTDSVGLLTERLVLMLYTH